MKKLLLISISILVVLSSCKINPKDDDPQPNEPQSMEDLNISSSFDWKTTTDYSLSLKSQSSNVVIVTSTDGTVYYQGFIKSGVTLETKLTLPSYEEKILLKFKGDTVELDLSGSNLSYDFN